MTNKIEELHRWRFFRSGGFDQVRLDNGADLASLAQLDQKLWATLSCPTKGLEFDPRTLALLDSDNDGRIRVPEVLAAVQWACRVVKNPDELTQGAAALPLASINVDDVDGKQLYASAKQILRDLGKSESDVITTDDTADTKRIFEKTQFNGDGIVTATATNDADIQQAIKEIIACMGAETDRSGQPGISQKATDDFFAALHAYSDWWKQAENDAARVLPIGEHTLEVADVWRAVRAKIDDYFMRCRLAAFDERATTHLNRDEKDFDALALQMLSAGGAELASFPLARVEPGKALPLVDGLNPAWQSAMAAFRANVVQFVLGGKTEMTADEWATICSTFAPLEAWLAKKPATPVEALGLARIRVLLSGRYQPAINALIAQDKALEQEANAVTSVDRLIHYYRDLYTLLNNFVSFRDFYTRRAQAIFRAGTLFIDGRSCELCVRVEDIGKHSALATSSRTYLIYCDCTRRGSAEKMTVAVAVTAGDSDNLTVGRNGVFYDRQGRDWDATIVKIIDNPISIGQAFLAPYKRIGRMISDQIEKFAVARDKAVQDQALTGVTTAAQKAEVGKPAPPPFDVGKFAGIFAAIGLAVGAIGTAIAAVLTGFMGLKFWQMPLAIGGLFLAVSGPSMLIAFLKLRQRNLAPILDANGWAINTRATINIAFGGALTSMAALPAGSVRSLDDPYAEKKRPWKTYTVLLLIVVALGYAGYKGYITQWVAKLSHISAPAATAPPADTAAPK